MARDGVGPWLVAASGSDAEVLFRSSESVVPTVPDSEGDLMARMGAASPVRAPSTLEGVAAGDHEVVLPRLLPDDSDEGSSESSTTPRGPRVGGDRPGAGGDRPRPQPGRRLLTIWHIGVQEASLSWEASFGVSGEWLGSALQLHRPPDVRLLHRRHDFPGVAVARGRERARGWPHAWPPRAVRPHARRAHRSWWPRGAG